MLWPSSTSSGSMNAPLRAGASHGVGLLHRLAGPEGTYAVLLTAPDAYLQQFLDATPRAPGRNSHRLGSRDGMSAGRRRLTRAPRQSRALRAAAVGAMLAHRRVGVGVVEDVKGRLAVVDEQVERFADLRVIDGDGYVAVVGVPE